jgi:hypothetical protein
MPGCARTISPVTLIGAFRSGLSRSATRRSTLAALCAVFLDAISTALTQSPGSHSASPRHRASNRFLIKTTIDVCGNRMTSNTGTKHRL